ncbi:type I phosphomannose isomerase catalytic subunit [Pedobacter helvus]|uniref:Type I phosphomannose isomerase catalytic subunit n=1 Tax=Pedobacter helvus TaxID=2563444 RepID=A0ABW9JCX9_9SPHI|nr:type I phosphomannose isomerase catalytic subunit [Pedobacter ureilyticus]
MTTLYPFKFKTIFKDKIWGGNKIKTHLKKDFGSLPNCGETWEISAVKGNVSVVANGNLAGNNLAQLIEEYQHKLVGNKVYQRFGNEFPLLIKFIDANDDLSIQVHPDDTLAKARHNSFGKTEMWYVLQADEGATLISGFNQKVDEQTYLNKLNNGQINDILNKEQVNTGDVFFLPAGRVHTIGKGLMIAEIQQTSDITYRIYDFDRVDDKGQKRELHTEEALAAIDYNVYANYKSEYEKTPNQVNEVVACPYFKTNFMDLTAPLKRNYKNLDTFKILICVAGAFSVVANNYPINVGLGECILIPATVEEIEILTNTGAKILETYID